MASTSELHVGRDVQTQVGVVQRSRRRVDVEDAEVASAMNSEHHVDVKRSEQPQTEATPRIGEVVVVVVIAISPGPPLEQNRPLQWTGHRPCETTAHTRETHNVVIEAAEMSQLAIALRHTV